MFLTFLGGFGQFWTVLDILHSSGLSEWFLTVLDILGGSEKTNFGHRI